jgi:hypothetical protein
MLYLLGASLCNIVCKAIRRPVFANHYLLCVVKKTDSTVVEDVR